MPGDFDAAVLVAPSVRPEDNTFLYHARGIVSTGGGILSHAGLIATQFRKPALIVSGQWQREPDGSLHACSTARPSTARSGARWRAARSSLFRDWREREHRLREGDLVVLDAVQGTLRVLGQERDALALARGALAARRGGPAPRAAPPTRRSSWRCAGTACARPTRSGRSWSGSRTPCSRATRPTSSLLGRGPRGGGREPRRPGGAPLAAPPESRRRGGRARLPRRARPGAAGAPRRPRGRGPPALSRRRPPPTRSWPGGSTTLRLGRGRWRRPLARCARAASSRPRRRPPAVARHRRAWPSSRLARAARRAACGSSRPLPRAMPGGATSSARSSGSTSSSAAPARPSVRRARAAPRRGGRGRPSARSRDRRVVTAEEGGFELHPLIGWKAANLAEVARLGGGLVPPWFVVTDRAFEEVLDAPLGPPRAPRPSARGVHPPRGGRRRPRARRPRQRPQVRPHPRPLGRGAAPRGAVAGGAGGLPPPRGAAGRRRRAGRPGGAVRRHPLLGPRGGRRARGPGRRVRDLPLRPRRGARCSST